MALSHCIPKHNPTASSVAVYVLAEDVTPLAKRVPNVRLGKDPEENNINILHRAALVNIVGWLEHHPDRIVATWASVQANLIKEVSHKSHDVSAPWNKAYRQPWRLFDY